MTATYYRGGFGRSRNAEAALENGRAPASHIARAIGRGVTAEFIAAAAPHGGEWHHTGKFASEVKYYDIAEVSAWLETEAGAAALAEYKAARKAGGVAAFAGEVTYEEWEKNYGGRFGKKQFALWTVTITGRFESRGKNVKVLEVFASEVSCAGGSGECAPRSEVAGETISAARRGFRRTVWEKAEAGKYRRALAAKKAAATRAAKKAAAAAQAAADKAAAARTAAIGTIAAAVLAAPALPLALPAPRCRTVAEWAASGCKHPCAAEVLAVKAASGLGWNAFERAARTGKL